MFSFIFIIFCFFTPQNSALCATTKSAEKDANQDYKFSTKELKNINEKGLNSTKLANLSLQAFKTERYPESLILIEKSLAQNPYSLKAHKLRAAALEKLNVNGRQVPFVVYLADALPSPVVFFLFLLFLSLSSKSLMSTLKKEDLEGLPSLENRVQFGLYAAATCLIVGLYIYKAELKQNSWACNVQETNTYTGPDTELPLIRVLQPGQCYKVVRTQPQWVSFYSLELAGWVPTSGIIFIRN